MSRRKIDPKAIRESLERVDRIIEGHPELVSQDGEGSAPEAWEATLEEAFRMKKIKAPTEEQATEVVNMRVPVSLLERADEVGNQLETEGLFLSRSGVLRYLIEQGYKAVTAKGK